MNTVNSRVPKGSGPLGILSIAGADPSAGAGAQGDLQTILAHGAQPFCVITAITAQNSTVVDAVSATDPSLLVQQLRAIASDYSIHAIKTGLLPTASSIDSVSEFIEEHWPHLPLVVDPVISSSTGTRLVDHTVTAALVEKLLPMATVITPNVAEAEVLGQQELKTLQDARQIGRHILGMGGQAVLVKGGHLVEDHATDLLVKQSSCIAITGTSIPTSDVHGTGCAYATAIACGLARGVELELAIREAKSYITRAISEAYSIGEGSKHLQHFPSTNELR